MMRGGPKIQLTHQESEGRNQETGSTKLDGKVNEKSKKVLVKTT